MREINIGSKRFSKAVAMDDPEFNANHAYVVIPSEVTPSGPEIPPNFAVVNFQKGPIKENGVNGCHNEDLIAIVIDRITSLNQGDFRCRENALAITKLEEALLWLNKRTQDRQNRGVEGTSNK